MIAAFTCIRVTVTNTIDNSPYSVNIRFLSASLTSQLDWAYAIIWYRGIESVTPYVYCMMVNSSAFIVSIPGGPPV